MIDEKNQKLSERAKERRLIVKKKIEKKLEQNAKKAKNASAPNPAVKKVKLLITIVDKNKAEFYTDLLQSFEVNMQLCTLANGTATSEMRHVLGLEDTQKAVLWSFIREDRVSDALATLEEKFNTIKNGKGIAYTVPLTGVIGVAIYQFLSNNRMNKEGK